MESKLRILKKIIIIMIVVICVLSMVYFLIIKKLDQNVNDFANNTPTDTTPIELQKDIQEVKTRDMYYVMKDITKRYFEYIKEYNEDSYYSKIEGTVNYTEEDKKAQYEILYKFLDSQYLKDNKILENDIKNITKIMLKQVEKRLKQQKYIVEIDEKVIDKIYEQGYDSNFGARPLRRTIQNLVEDRISEEILAGNLKKNQKWVLKMDAF